MTHHCRFCQTPLTDSFCDLGMSPLSNAFLSADQLDTMEPFFPLHAYVCSECFLVQLPEFSKPEDIFTDYAYFSSFSDSWLDHARHYSELVIARLGLDARNRVVELASNDGYLLQYFHGRGIPVLGIEPAANVAEAARAKGIPTLARFFGQTLADELVNSGQSADLIIANNVLAHAPALNDFVKGIKRLLKPKGCVTVEFPHLLALIEQNEFDTIYHEHFSYFSLTTVERIFMAQGLRIHDVEEIPTHGGSLRIYAGHIGEEQPPTSGSVANLRSRERGYGLLDPVIYRRFAEGVKACKRELLSFLIKVKSEGKRVVGYGAPAKGNTLLNYCGIRSDFLDYTVDRSPHKQGLFLPGTHIPIYAPERIANTKPDYLLILPWNIKEEIIDQMGFIRDWGGKFVIPIPSIKILS